MIGQIFTQIPSTTAAGTSLTSSTLLTRGPTSNAPATPTQNVCDYDSHKNCHSADQEYFFHNRYCKTNYKSTGILVRKEKS